MNRLCHYSNMGSWHRV